MATEKQIAANRRNARLSTGPRSAAGKQAIARNAHRHGLSVLDRSSRLALAPRFDRVVADLIGNDSDPRRTAVATEIAAAEFDRIEVRAVKECLTYLGANSTPASLSAQLSNFLKLDRYEQHARARRNRAIAIWMGL